MKHRLARMGIGDGPLFAFSAKSAVEWIAGTPTEPPRQFPHQRLQLAVRPKRGSIIWTRVRVAVARNRACTASVQAATSSTKIGLA
jgi:hypothetical protein